MRLFNQWKTNSTGKEDTSKYSNNPRIRHSNYTNKYIEYTYKKKFNGYLSTIIMAISVVFLVLSIANSLK